MKFKFQIGAEISAHYFKSSGTPTSRTHEYVPQEIQEAC